MHTYIRNSQKADILTSQKPSTFMYIRGAFTAYTLLYILYVLYIQHILYILYIPYILYYDTIYGT